ncbi:VLRF1 family aeRF1-type release factor [Salipaludibacillus daqingensis]|uniref:VLRF1 family aeRF1-type release factor n=1 Tax=Salipaludibacillus daqingensis TaxID=3041001 RepID=UPI002476C787|nr:VLRF1 family aeRF1-type release factor [Salipaludibacillus daqingensis]
MALENELQNLKDFTCAESKCVLSIYLNTDPADQDQQKGEWKIRLKNGLNRIQEYLDASSDESELKSYKKLKKKVDNEIQQNRTALQKGVIIFASEHEDLWSVHYLQVPVETSFHWEASPVLDQLNELHEKYPRAGVILPNQDEVKVIDTSLGEVNDERTYQFDPGSEDWSFKEGLASSDRTASGASHVDKLQQRFEENRHRFYKKMAGNVEQLKKDRGWKEVYLVGEAEMIRSFETSLRTKPAGSVNKNLNNAATTKVLEEVFHS